MNKVIWKFPVPTGNGNFELSMPKGAKVLSVQLQNNEGQLWAIVDPEAEREQRRLLVIGTGHEAAFKNFYYIGSFQSHNGTFIWHVFQHNYHADKRPLLD